LEYKDIIKSAYYYDKNGMLLKGDCLEWMTKFPDKSIDMILCDLPYGTTACKWDIIIPLDKLWEQYNRIIKDNGAMCFTATQPFTSVMVMSNINNFKYEWIWDKKKPVGWLLAKKQPMRQHESVLVFYKKQPTYNNQPYKKSTLGHLSENIPTTFVETIGQEKSYNGKGNKNEEGYARSIISEIPVLNNLGKDKSGFHPTQKPVALFEYLIKTYTNENEIILDNTAGSCTTGVACKNTKRKYICIEQSQKYCDVSAKRLEDTAG